MYFLNMLEKYIKRYADDLTKSGWKIIDKIDGPGLGAVITFSKNDMNFDLINDRDEIYANMKNAKEKIDSIDIKTLVDIINIHTNGKKVSDLSYDEKIAYWADKTGNNDPIPYILKYGSEITMLFSKEMIKSTFEEKKAYYQNRGKWMF